MLQLMHEQKTFEFGKSKSASQMIRSINSLF